MPNALRATSLLMKASALAAAVLCTQAGCQRGEMSPIASDLSNTGIVNGTVATGTEPWAHSVIAIAKKSMYEGYSVYCTGTLINEKTIVTAAHCVDAMSNNDYVLFGLKEKDKAVQTRKIVRSQLNQQYKSWFPDDAKDVYDIGIAEFEGGLPQGFTPAEVLQDDAFIQDGTDVILAGYGVTSGRTQAGAGILRSTVVKVAESSYGEFEVKTNETNNGSCNGDSGGPGFVEKDGKIYLWGATSRGDSLCQKEGIYTRVHKFSEWIDTTLAKWSKTQPKPQEPDYKDPGTDTDADWRLGSTL